jgi:hypothetical protein
MMEDLFGFDDIKLGDEEKKYSKKVDIPTYMPREGRGGLHDCYDPQKYFRLIHRIDKLGDGVSQEEKKFLKLSAGRFIEFNYEAIADHYAKANNEAKGLMEKLALVIIDFDKAIQEGFVQLNDKMKIIYEQERKNRTQNG